MNDLRIERHSRVLAEKPALSDLFADIHRYLQRLDDTWITANGSRIELGAGVAPIRDTFSDTLASDIVPAANLDAVFDAQNLAVEPASVRTLYLQNSFHHLPDPEAFFRSSERALSPGGGIVMLEPNWGPVASLIFPRLFSSEGFDKRQKSWKTPISGPMDGANQALSYIVLKRDYSRFKELFPCFDLVASGVLPSYLRYVLSGGLNFPQLVPTSMFPVIKKVESLISPVAEVVGLHRWFVLIKKHG